MKYGFQFQIITNLKHKFHDYQLLPKVEVYYYILINAGLAKFFTYCVLSISTHLVTTHLLSTVTVTVLITAQTISKITYLFRLDFKKATKQSELCIY